MLYACHNYHMRATVPAHLVLLDLIPFCKLYIFKINKGLSLEKTERLHEDVRLIIQRVNREIISPVQMFI
jgi:hypothetical protein